MHPQTAHSFAINIDSSFLFCSEWGTRDTVVAKANQLPAVTDLELSQGSGLQTHVEVNLMFIKIKWN